MTRTNAVFAAILAVELGATIALGLARLKRGSERNTR